MTTKKKRIEAKSTGWSKDATVVNLLCARGIMMTPFKSRVYHAADLLWAQEVIKNAKPGYKAATPIMGDTTGSACSGVKMQTGSRRSKVGGSGDGGTPNSKQAQ